MKNLIKLSLAISLVPFTSFSQDQNISSDAPTAPVDSLTVSSPISGGMASTADINIEVKQNEDVSQNVNGEKETSEVVPDAPVMPLEEAGADDADKQVVKQSSVIAKKASPKKHFGLSTPKSMQDKNAVANKEGEAQKNNSAAPVAIESPANSQNEMPKPEEDKQQDSSSAKPVVSDGEDVGTMFRSQFDNASNNSMTMEKLLSDAYVRNPSINAARDGLKAADETVSQAFAGYLPRVNATYGKGYQEVGFNGFPSDTYYTTSRAVGLSQGLFGSGETYFNMKAAEKRVLAARSELKNAEQQFFLEAINAYVNYIFTQKVLELAINNERVLHEQLGASQQRFDVGDATRTDVAQSEARLANASSSRVLSEGDFINAKANFKRIFLVDAVDNLPMPSKMPEIPASYDEALKAALNNNPQIGQAKYQAEGAENDIKARESQLGPQVDFNGSISKADQPSLGTLYNVETKTAGVQLTMPIYNAGLDYARTREARNRRNQAQKLYDDAVNLVTSNVTQAWQQISTSAANIEATRASLRASDLALQGVRDEQREGARTVLDVLDAEQERFISETSHARAIKDSVIAIYFLKATLGELTPNQLGLEVNDYDPSIHYKNSRFKLIGL